MALQLAGKGRLLAVRGSRLVLEREKHRNLQGKQDKHSIKDHAGWNERLASDSEAAIKADKDPHLHEPHDEHIKKLQKHTEDFLREDGRTDSARPKDS